MSRYLTLAAHLRRIFATRVQKIPLDAGFTCPNRDGTLSHTGCAFCNPRGSGSGLAAKGLSLREQWDLWHARLRKKYKARLFLAYLQSFSNTYGPASRLRKVLDEMRNLPDIAGLCIGTRPDCLDAEKLGIIAALPASVFRDVWLELGLQSASDKTLALINRGHDAACFVRAAHQAAEAGLKVCVHVIAGLPGEGREDFLATVDLVSSLPVAGIKFHNLYIAKGTALAALHARGAFVPISAEAYEDWIAEGVARLRPGIVVHRLVADPEPGELLAPTWAADKRGTVAGIEARMERDGLRQGDHCLVRSAAPAGGQDENRETI